MERKKKCFSCKSRFFFRASFLLLFLLMLFTLEEEEDWPLKVLLAFASPKACVNCDSHLFMLLSLFLQYTVWLSVEHYLFTYRMSFVLSTVSCICLLTSQRIWHSFIKKAKEKKATWCKIKRCSKKKCIPWKLQHCPGFRLIFITEIPWKNQLSSVTLYSCHKRQFYQLPWRRKLLQQYGWQMISHETCISICNTVGCWILSVQHNCSNINNTNMLFGHVVLQDI